MAGDEWHLHTGHFLGNRARLLWIAGIVTDLELEFLAEHAAGGVDVGNRKFRAILHLLESGSPYGTYNVSSDGDPMTWAGIARTVFQARGRDAGSVKSVTTTEYAAGKSLAPRPRHSTLSLDKIIRAGFQPVDAMTRLQEYLSTQS